MSPTKQGALPSKAEAPLQLLHPVRLSRRAAWPAGALTILSAAPTAKAASTQLVAETAEPIERPAHSSCSRGGHSVSKVPSRVHSASAERSAEQPV